MPDTIQTLFVAGTTGAFVILGAVLLGVSIWSQGKPNPKKRDRRAA